MTNPARLDSGRFWLPDAPGQHAAACCRLTLAPGDLGAPLTQAMRESERNTGPDGQVTMTSVPADDDIDPDAFTVHGHLRRGPRRITLVGATTAGRRMVLGGRGADHGGQRPRADYALSAAA